MTKEDKELLLKDLCARLPYGVKVLVDVEKEPEVLYSINTFRPRVTFSTTRYHMVYIENIKPYLRPLSSMTDGQIDEYHKRCEFNDCDYTCEPMYFDTLESFDYLYSIHVDCRGLIPLGLALEAPEGMYKTE